MGSKLGLQSRTGVAGRPRIDFAYLGGTLTASGNRSLKLIDGKMPKKVGLRRGELPLLWPTLAREMGSEAYWRGAGARDETAGRLILFAGEAGQG